jgi:Lrp/AsnC family leucine-responsive transcriptional regulator
LSSSAALRWVKRVEEAGVIGPYVALVRAERIGLGLTAYINVRMAKHSGSDKRSPMDVFAAAVQTWPEVVECVSLTGEMDYLLRVVVADMADYSRFVMETLLRHPSVQDCHTNKVMNHGCAGVTLTAGLHVVCRERSMSATESATSKLCEPLKRGSHAVR